MPYLCVEKLYVFRCCPCESLEANKTDLFRDGGQGFSYKYNVTSHPAMRDWTLTFRELTPCKRVIIKKLQ